MNPYYADESVTLYHSDCLSTPEWQEATTLVTDPPYGIDYRSGHQGTLPRSIAGDKDTAARDAVLALWPESPALVFGTWRIPRPSGTRSLLVWDTKGALGMGDLSIPWKPAHQEIYVIGRPFTGPRTSDVLRYAPVQSSAYRGRTHPHEKPVALMSDLIAKTVGSITDPFCGTGSTLVAAKALGRKAIGVELDERYCEIAALRLSQGVLDFGEAG